MIPGTFLACYIAWAARVTLAQGGQRLATTLSNIARSNIVAVFVGGLARSYQCPEKNCSWWASSAIVPMRVV